MLTKKQAAEFLGISTRSLERLVTKGDVAAKHRSGKFGIETVFEQKELERYRAAQSEKSQALVTVKPQTPTTRPKATAPVSPAAALGAPGGTFDDVTAAFATQKLALTVEEATKFVPLSAGHLRRAIREKKLRAVRLGRGYVLLPGDLIRYLRAAMEAPAGLSDEEGE